MSMIPRCSRCDAPLDPYGRDGTLCKNCGAPTVTDAMKIAGCGALSENLALGSDSDAKLVTQIYLAMHNARTPATPTSDDVEQRVRRDIESAMICLAKRAEEIGAHPPSWQELALEAARAAITAMQPPQPT